STGAGSTWRRSGRAWRRPRPTSGAIRPRQSRRRSGPLARSPPPDDAGSPRVRARVRPDAGVNDGDRGRRVACAALAAAAAYETFGVVWWRARHGLGELAYDFYNLFYPNAVHAVRAFASGGRGLLW